MRIDVVSIFPEYLAALAVSLVGKAADTGILDVHVHDLRSWTHDVHRSVDDSPYGGGAGMVMTAPVWGEALDDVLAMGEGLGGVGTVLVIPSPAGYPFTHDEAGRLARARRLVFACGRYEGIDQRVADHYAGRDGVEVRELSIGDYVIAGGEAAVLVMVEAVARLLPGVIGNPESLVEESHADTLLEYPVYTRPESWRGLDVPPMLLSGHHARIAEWRHAQSRARTAERRPDLLPPPGQ
ncbi:MAG: tRNA (guanosine(37)-N1)-methyltransferase TrmD [Bifidobacteriaceae bacterium]|jgi:tRNA (guanine37-N1)-methyltransferase|nr:tRNA (guanosine(37)-N1)-methyltransferase TrmD [Bifidobacteriaceae bacterium]